MNEEETVVPKVFKTKDGTVKKLYSNHRSVIQSSTTSMTLGIFISPRTFCSNPEMGASSSVSQPSQLLSFCLASPVVPARESLSFTLPCRVRSRQGKATRGKLSRRETLLRGCFSSNERVSFDSVERCLASGRCLIGNYGNSISNSLSAGSRH